MACTLLRGQILVKLVIAIATIDFFLFENCNCNLNNACDESSQELFSNIFTEKVMIMSSYHYRYLYRPLPFSGQRYAT